MEQIKNSTRNVKTKFSRESNICLVFFKKRKYNFITVVLGSCKGLILQIWTADCRAYYCEWSHCS